MKNYQDLSPKIQTIFRKLGFMKLENRGKPYYKGLKQGKVYRVFSENKLKELKDGASETEYGYVKLKQVDGTFKDEAVHRLIAESIPNEGNKPVVHHKKIARNKNGIDDLEWVTYKENHDYMKSGATAAEA